MGEAIKKYAREIQNIIDNDTIGACTWEGLLAEFYREAKMSDHRAEAERLRAEDDEVVVRRVVVKRAVLKAIVDTRPCAVSDPDECSLCELRAALDAEVGK